LFSHRSEAQRTEAYASPLRSLRPCWKAILSILTLFWREHRTENSSHIFWHQPSFSRSMLRTSNLTSIADVQQTACRRQLMKKGPRVLMEGLKELVEYGVIGLLLGLSVWAIGVAVERWLFYRRVDIRQFPTLDLCEVMLTRRLVVIGTVAANAPYIGLLGTVLGIMLTFHTMGTSGALAVASIMIGLSLALKATAAGLLVAIPCVVMNNVLRRRVSDLLAQYKAQHGT